MWLKSGDYFVIFFLSIGRIKLCGEYRDGIDSKKKKIPPLAAQYCINLFILYIYQ